MAFLAPCFHNEQLLRRENTDGYDEKAGVINGRVICQLFPSLHIYMYSNSSDLWYTLCVCICMHHWWYSNNIIHIFVCINRPGGNTTQTAAVSLRLMNLRWDFEYFCCCGLHNNPWKEFPKPLMWWDRWKLCKSLWVWWLASEESIQITTFVNKANEAMKLTEETMTSKRVKQTTLEQIMRSLSENA